MTIRKSIALTYYWIKAYIVEYVEKLFKRG
jgi:hypothetical protein